VLGVVTSVKNAEAGVLLRIETVEHAGRQKRFEPVSPLDPFAVKRHLVRIAQGGVFSCPVDLPLHDDRLVAVGTAAGRQEGKHMAIATGAVRGPRVSGVEPEGQAVGTPRPGGIALRRVVLAANFQLNADAPFVPRQR
jgi:hypothetical protein